MISSSVLSYAYVVVAVAASVVLSPILSGRSSTGFVCAAGTAAADSGGQHRRSRQEEEFRRRLLQRRTSSVDGAEQHHEGETGRRRRRQRELQVDEYDDNSEDDIRQYVLWKPEEIPDALNKWAKHYPDLVRVTTAQEAYGLPRAGDTDDCPFDDGEGCLNYILTIQDFIRHPTDSDSSARLPEVLWSGEVHGDERVGPTSVLEAAQLLLDCASCEAIPDMALKGTAGWEKEMQNALSCRDELEKRGIHPKQRQWLARLVSTRRIVVVPTANALGYYRVVRTEGLVDPNRDFPYDLSNPSECMKTIAGRTLNEVFREHMFQLSLTMHGGMEGTN